VRKKERGIEGRKIGMKDENELGIDGKACEAEEGMEGVCAAAISGVGIVVFSFI